MDAFEKIDQNYVVAKDPLVNIVEKIIEDVTKFKLDDYKYQDPIIFHWNILISLELKDSICLLILIW